MKAVSRIMQEFSQADPSPRPCYACSSSNEDQAQHQSLIPGMSAYDSQDAIFDAGPAECNLSFSTKATHCEEYTIFSQASDGESESEESHHTS